MKPASPAPADAVRQAQRLKTILVSEILIVERGIQVAAHYTNQPARQPFEVEGDVGD